MASEIKMNYQSDEFKTDECKNCRVCRFFGTDVVECHEKKDCDWVVHFGYSRFCKHPSALQYTRSAMLPRLFS